MSALLSHGLRPSRNPIFILSHAISTLPANIRFAAWTSTLTRLFVYGFVGGIVQGQDRVAQQLLLKARAGTFRPECHQAVSKNANRLETEMTQMDRHLFIGALDAFYAVPSNRPLELKWAVLVVMQQLKGISPGDIDRYIEDLKRRAP